MTGKRHDELRAIVESGGDADAVLRSVVHLLAAEPDITWAQIAFVENERLMAGPEEGLPDESLRMRTPIVYEGSTVGELLVDGEVEPAFLERVSALISAYVLIGWDTGGEVWEP